MSDGGSRVIDPKIFEYLAKPESGRVAMPSEDFSTDANKQESQKELQTAFALALTPPNSQSEKKKRGFFSFFRRKPKDGTQKKLLAPQFFECGMCNKKMEVNELYTHWQTHTITIADDPKLVVHDSPMRSTLKRRSMCFIVRRPPYGIVYQTHLNEELTTAKYFATAIILLKQQHPEMRFQYVPVCMGDSGVYLRTLLIVAEWDEE